MARKETSDMKIKCTKKAVADKVILCTTNPFGKKEYLLPLPAPVQQDLPF